MKESTAVMACMALLCLVALNACERTVSTTTVAQEPQNCFACHSDQDTRLVSAEGQYRFSIHASGNNIDRNTSSCSGCHVSEGFVARFTGGTAGDYPNPTAIHCFTCHAPHTNSNFNLRVTAPQPLMDGTTFDLGAANICTACHQARRDVNTYITDPETLDQRWGPHHGPQSDMLIGSNGYEYSGYTYEQTNHRGVTENGCKDCHFDATSNYRVGGHSFNMTFVDVTETFENTGSCDRCHGVDDFDVNNAQTNTTALIDQLRTILETAGLLDGTDHPTSATTSADSAGAVWNFLMAHEDRSVGVHNRKYIQGLLRSAIEFFGATPVNSPAMAARETEQIGGSR